MRAAIAVLLVSLGASAPALAHKPHDLTTDGKRYTVLHGKASKAKPALTKGLPKPGGLLIAHKSPKNQTRLWNLLRYRAWPAQYRAMLKRKAQRLWRARLSAPPGWAAAHSDVSFCESGNRPWISGAFYGKWQFHWKTWRGFTAWSSIWPYAHQAPEWAQDGAAYRLWSNSGQRFGGHWPVCGAGQ